MKNETEIYRPSIKILFTRLPSSAMTSKRVKNRVWMNVKSSRWTGRKTGTVTGSICLELSSGTVLSCVDCLSALL